MVLLQRKLYFFTDPEGVQYFPRGSNFIQGVQMLISIETNITCDFPGGGGQYPLYPLWILTCKMTQYCVSAGVVLLYLLYLLVWCLTISHVCWYSVSLSAMTAEVVLYYTACLFVWCITIIRACWCGASL